MKTVLIVEDPVGLRVFAKILTKRGGLKVKETEDVEEVMKIVQAGDADMILIDVSLTHSAYQGQPVDAIKITQMLKGDAQTSNLPIILVTARGMETDHKVLLQQSGADGYISKPIVDHQQFVEQIWTLLLG